MQIIDDLHQFKTSMIRPQLPYVMSYLFEDQNEGLTLFDTGFGTDQAYNELKISLQKLGYQISDLSRVIISHAHPDHIGMVGKIRQDNSDFKLIMSKDEYEWINSRKDRDWQKIGNDWMEQHGLSIEEINASKEDSIWKNIEWPDLSPDLLVVDADKLLIGKWSFQFISTPGHTKGHICLYEKNYKLMLTGDHVLPHISPNVSVDFQGKHLNALVNYINSLKKMLSFDTDIVLPAHEYAFTDLEERVNELLLHHKNRLSEHLAIFNDGSLTAAEVAKKISWNTGSFDGFNLMMKRSAIGETVAHLEYLVTDNALVKINGGHKEVNWQLA